MGFEVQGYRANSQEAATTGKKKVLPEDNYNYPNVQATNTNPLKNISIFTVAAFGNTSASTSSYN